MSSLSKPRTRTLLGALALVAVLLEGLFLLLARYHPFDDHIPEAVTVALVAGTLYCTAVYLIWRIPPGHRATLILILVAAVVFRLTLLPLPPTLSNDIHRYRWEGRIQRAGLNPYEHAPSDPAVAPYLTGLDAIPGKDVSAAYGPAVEVSFHLAARWGESMAFKLLSLLFDLLVIVFVILLLRQRGSPAERVLIYAWSPLVVIEYAGSAHIDSMMVALLLLALWLNQHKQPALSLASLTAATLSKWTAGLLLPLFLRQTNWRAWPVVVLVTGILYWPYLDAGPGLVAGMGAYTEKWRNNGSLHALLTWVTGQDAVAQGVLAGVMAGLLVYLVWKKAELLRASYLLLATLLFLSPNVFPWYLTWLLPFLCFFPNPALLLWSTTVLLSYNVLIRYSTLGTWQYQPELAWLEYLPVFTWLLWKVWKVEKRNTPDKT